MYELSTNLKKDLPPHITLQQVIQLVDKTKNDRDRLLIHLLWETGGRINDILNIKVENIDFYKKILSLYVNKNNKVLEVPLTSDLLLNISNYMNSNNIKNGYLFTITRQRAWQIIKKSGREIGIYNLHPHMFRHGLAVHMLTHGVPIPIISKRLGHSTTKITMDYYMVITPEMQAQFLDNIYKD
ncbi:MAG: tyrosine-type recombinase/integrase [Thermoplasmata archaeon]